MRKSIVRGLVIGSASALVAGFGVSFAAWNVTGANAAPTGGNSKGYQSVPLGVTHTELTQGAYPTLVENETVTVTNSNDFAVKLANLTTHVTSADLDCRNAMSTQQTSSSPAYTATIDAAQLLRLTKNTSAEITVPLTFTNSFPQACENKALSVTFTATGSSAQ